MKQLFTIVILTLKWNKKNNFYLANCCSTVVEHSTTNNERKGSNPAVTQLQEKMKVKKESV
jgi:hypothetical protein